MPAHPGPRRQPRRLRPTAAPEPQRPPTNRADADADAGTATETATETGTGTATETETATETATGTATEAVLPRRD
jgi:hypothetical protein